MRAISKNLWAPVVTNTKGYDWIIWTCVRTTKKEAKRAYLFGIEKSCIKGALDRVRFSKVTIFEHDKEKP